jgi:hypothetical protein
MTRRKRMKVFQIENISMIEVASPKIILTGNKAILIPRSGNPILGPSNIPHINLVGVEYKYCPCCKHWKTLNTFNKQKLSPDGLKDKCRECDNLQRRERYAKTKAVT